NPRLIRHHHPRAVGIVPARRREEGPSRRLTPHAAVGGGEGPPTPVRPRRDRPDRPSGVKVGLDSFDLVGYMIGNSLNLSQWAERCADMGFHVRVEREAACFVKPLPLTVPQSSDTRLSVPPS